jgi:hypothetical protein
LFRNISLKYKFKKLQKIFPKGFNYNLDVNFLDSNLFNYVLKATSFALLCNYQLESFFKNFKKVFKKKNGFN